MARIVKGRNLPHDSRYVTVSHRWAPTTQLLHTMENSAELQNGFSVSQLPKTFRDAIVVAKSIGIPYLWIDCLCIIQKGDGGKDWEAEAAQMHLVYQYAHVNIAANEASEENGLFFKRDADLFGQARLPDLTLNHLPGITDWISIDYSMWSTQINNSPLNKRGWVLQERVLAARIVHFSKQEVFWECREQQLCESFPRALPEKDFFNLGEAVSLRLLDLWEGSHRLSHKDLSREDCAYEVWDGIVKMYSKCNFTFPRDKLVALSGVTHRLKEILTGDGHLAGMWRKTLAQELSWWMYPMQKRYIWGEEPDYYAPSFSWASVRGAISSEGPFALGVLVDVECVTMEAGRPGPGNRKSSTEDELFDTDVIGLLSSPTFKLRVSGLIRTVRVSKVKTRWWASLRVPAIFSEPSSPVTNKEVTTASKTLRLTTLLDFDIREADVPAFEAEIFYIMVWRHGPKAGEPDTADTTVHCLLLKQLDRDWRLFRRVGWTMNSTLEGKISLLASVREDMLEGMFDEETGKHTIYLV